MIINLLIPDELKKDHNSFNECIVNDNYIIKLVNWKTLGHDTVSIPKHIVIEHDLSRNLMQIDDSNLELIKVIESGGEPWLEYNKKL